MTVPQQSIHPGMRKIIVLTPIKNEDWILARFLAVCSQFADLIIVADQQSTDSSRAICGHFAKVRLIENNSAQYDEGQRQRLLLQEARRLVPGEKFILALDADEILTANSLGAASWQQVHTAPPGAVFFYQKPDIMFPATLCRQYEDNFPLGYVDDGGAHSGGPIHSTRVPLHAASLRIEVTDIKFAHLAHVRPEEFWARQRLYSVIERIKRTKPIWQRLNYYSPRVNRRTRQTGLSPTPSAWLLDWQAKGIDLGSFPSTDLNHYNEEIIQMMIQHGPEKFYLDDIWDVDWAELYHRFLTQNPNGCVTEHARLNSPPWFYRVLTRSLVALIKLRRGLQHK